MDRAIAPADSSPLACVHRFFEDFEGGTPEPEPPPAAASVPVMFSVDDLARIHDEAYAAGHAAGLSEAAADESAAVSRQLAAIAAALQAARDTTRLCVERSALAIADLMLAALETLFPALCRAHGAREAAAAARALAESLGDEPTVTIQVAPEAFDAVQAELAALAPDLSARIQCVAGSAMPSGDVRVEWRHGIARRDGIALLRSVLEVARGAFGDMPDHRGEPAADAGVSS
jgi:hypothetical protein